MKLVNLADAGDRRLASLDALRGVAILLVIVSHFFPPTFPYAALISLSCGNCGVILFFFLSGFLMDHNLALDRRFFPYLVRRTFRILPMYWLSLLMVMLVRSNWTVGEALSNATFTTPITGSERMLGVYWTLYIEVLFYSLVPILRYLGEPAIRTAPFAAIGIFAIIWLARGNVNAALFYLLFCLSGMQFSAWNRGQLSVAWLGAAMAAVAVSSSVFPIVSVYLGLAPITCALILWWALRLERSFRPFEFLGRVSYSWYLLHSIFGYHIVVFLMHLSTWLWLSALVGGVVSLAASIVTFYIVERPAINLGKFVIARCHSMLPLSVESKLLSAPNTFSSIPHE